jgi:hypothetical protein
MRNLAGLVSALALVAGCSSGGARAGDDLESPGAAGAAAQDGGGGGRAPGAGGSPVGGAGGQAGAAAAVPVVLDDLDDLDGWTILRPDGVPAGAAELASVGIVAPELVASPYDGTGTALQWVSPAYGYTLTKTYHLGRVYTLGTYELDAYLSLGAGTQLTVVFSLSSSDGVTGLPSTLDLIPLSEIQYSINGDLRHDSAPPLDGWQSIALPAAPATFDTLTFTVSYSGDGTSSFIFDHLQIWKACDWC